MRGFVKESDAMLGRAAREGDRDGLKSLSHLEFGPPDGV